MTREILKVEFRYHDRPNANGIGEFPSKTITIGIYDTLSDAIEAGNKLLETLSKTFEVRSDDKFILNHYYGSPNRLVTNTCYPTKGIEYFAKIEELNFDSVTDTINETFKAYERYKEYREKEED